tara:strand:+ start:99 stop:389 length:291 start_codon:yes stop_codon:yes gene_type:complete
MSNLYLSDYEMGQDVSKQNRGGLNNPDTLINQGDLPVDIRDVRERAERNIEVSAMMYGKGTPFVAQPVSNGDINEGVSMIEPMYSEAIRKNSDYDY